MNCPCIISHLFCCLADWLLVLVFTIAEPCWQFQSCYCCTSLSLLAVEVSLFHRADHESSEACELQTDLSSAVFSLCHDARLPETTSGNFRCLRFLISNCRITSARQIAFSNSGLCSSIWTLLHTSRFLCRVQLGRIVCTICDHSRIFLVLLFLHV